MKVYVLTSGCYSDYHIIGVTLSEDTAKEIVRKIDSTWDEVYIEEYDTDFWSEFLRDGDMYQVDKINGTLTASLVRHKEFHLGEINHVKECYGVEVESFYRTYVMAKDKDHAIKIGSDLIAVQEYKDSITKGE